MSHIGICVSDWRRSLRFYHDLLGFRFVDERRVSGKTAEVLLELREVDLRVLRLEREGVTLELRHYESPGVAGGGEARPMNALGMSHLSLRVDDLDAAVGALRRGGARVLDATRVDDPEQGVKAVFVTDPDGTRIELVQRSGV